MKRSLQSSQPQLCVCPSSRSSTAVAASSSASVIRPRTARPKMSALRSSPTLDHPDTRRARELLVPAEVRARFRQHVLDVLHEPRHAQRGAQIARRDAAAPTSVHQPERPRDFCEDTGSCRSPHHRAQKTRAGVNEGVAGGTLRTHDEAGGCGDHPERTLRPSRNQRPPGSATDVAAGPLVSPRSWFSCSDRPPPSDGGGELSKSPSSGGAPVTNACAFLRKKRPAAPRASEKRLTG